MKVKELRISHLRNVIQAEFSFDENLVKISGKNGAGKSTVIDGIFLAILGKTYIGKGRSVENLISQGEKKTEIEVILEGNGKKLKIERKITESGNTGLDIWSSDWSKLQQKDLNLLLSEFTIDPLKFTGMTTKEQIEIIRTIAWVDTTEIEQKIDAKFEERKGANAILKEYSQTLQNLWTPEYVEKVDTSALRMDLQNRIVHNAKQDEIARTIVQKQEEQKRNLAKIEELKREISALETANQSIDSQIVLSKRTLSDKQDITEVQNKITNAEAINAKAVEFEKYKDLKEKTTQAEVNANKLTDELENLRAEKAEMIKNAHLPIEWLEFSDADWVMVNGIAFDQYSSAQQLVMACKIAKAINNELRVIYIKDWSLLDNDNLAELTNWASENDYQIFCERVGEEADSIIMREWVALS